MTVMLVDATNLLVRSAHAARRTPLSSEDGVPTAALLIFINMVSRHLREVGPDRLVLCWDGGKSLHRQAIWSGYKADRGDQVNEPERPVVQAKEFCSAANLHHVEREGFEADDLIANYWRQSRPIEDPIVIVSGDKDFLQLVGPQTTVSRPLDGGVIDVWDSDRVVAEYGCEPALLPYVKALMGDVSDGIPGLPGVGPKRAVKRLKEAGNSYLRLLEAHTDAERDVLLRNVRLMDLRQEAPYVALEQAPRFDPVRPGCLGYPELRAFLDRYQMHSVLTRLDTNTLWPEEKEPPTSST